MIGISFFTLLFKLVYKDSNLELQSQNLLCYHYTIDQSFCIFAVQRYSYFFNLQIFKRIFLRKNLSEKANLLIISILMFFGSVIFFEVSVKFCIFAPLLR